MATLTTSAPTAPPAAPPITPSAPPSARPSGPGPARDRRVAVAVTSAVAVVAVVVGVIVTVGRVPLPPMPSLAADPDPSIPGTVAFLHGDGDRSCLSLVAAGGGEPLDLRCGSWQPDALAWTTDGRLAVSSWDPAPVGAEARTVTVIDPVTGDEWGWAEVSSERWAADRLVREDGSRLVVDPSRDGIVTLRVRAPDGAGTELMRLQGPADYGLVSAQWSPDGQWVLGVDTRGRLFVLDADGDIGPRLLAELGGWEARWVLPAWSIDEVAAQRVDLGVLAAPLESGAR